MTTDKLHHSGEGIFFTSRIVDFFAAVSDKKVFSHSEYKDYLADISADSDNKLGLKIFVIKMVDCNSSSPPCRDDPWTSESAQNTSKNAPQCKFISTAVRL